MILENIIGLINSYW